MRNSDELREENSGNDFPHVKGISHIIVYRCSNSIITSTPFLSQFKPQGDKQHVQ